MPHKGKKRALKRLGHAVAPSSSSEKKAKRAKTTPGGGGGGGSGGGIGQGQIKTSIAKAKTAKGVLAAAAGSGGTLALSNNTLCQALYAIAKFGEGPKRGGRHGRKQNRPKGRKTIKF